MKKLLAIGISAAILSGCVIQRGSHIRTGEFKQPTAAESVKLYYQAPNQHYEILGMVTGEGSHAFVSDQHRMNVAIERMKKEAAALGANGVLLQSAGKTAASTGVYQQLNGNIGVMSRGGDSVANGLAIFVEN